jgi:hypothetical protein
MRYTWLATLFTGHSQGTKHGTAQCIPKEEIAGTDRG